VHAGMLNQVRHSVHWLIYNVPAFGPDYVALHRDQGATGVCLPSGLC
jgi:hypothetical protein